jgi:hypothetical protein
MSEQDKIEGKIELGSTTDILIKRTTFKGKRYIDIRKWEHGDRYTGPTKQGISIPTDKFEEILAILKGIEIDKYEQAEAEG